MPSRLGGTVQGPADSDARGVHAATVVPAGCGDRPGGKSLAYFLLEVMPLEIAQGKGAEGTLRVEPGLQVGPEEGSEEDIEMKVQFGQRAGLAVIEAGAAWLRGRQTRLGSGRRRSGRGVPAPASRSVLYKSTPSVVCGSEPRGRTYTTCRPRGTRSTSSLSRSCRPCAPGRGGRSDPRTAGGGPVVVRGDRYRGNAASSPCAADPRGTGPAPARPPHEGSAAVAAGSGHPACTEEMSRAPAVTASRSRARATSTVVSRPVAAPQVCRRARTVPGDCRAQRG